MNEWMKEWTNEWNSKWVSEWISPSLISCLNAKLFSVTGYVEVISGTGHVLFLKFCPILQLPWLGLAAASWISISLDLSFFASLPPTLLFLEHYSQFKAWPRAIYPLKHHHHSTTVRFEVAFLLEREFLSPRAIILLFVLKYSV